MEMAQQWQKKHARGDRKASSDGGALAVTWLRKTNEKELGFSTKTVVGRRWCSWGGKGGHRKRRRRLVRVERGELLVVGAKAAGGRGKK